MKASLISALAGIVIVSGFVSNGIALPVYEPNLTPAATAAVEIISVTRSGNADGRTVVLIPGLASGADVWKGTVAELADFDLRVVQVSGFAGAAKFDTSDRYTDAIAAAIHKHLTDFPGVDPVVVGHSLGGFVALKAALLDETPIRELVIVDSLPFLAALFMPGSTPEQAAQMAPVLARQMAEMPREAFDQQQKAGLVRLVKSKSFRAVLADWAAASDQATVATAVGELLESDLREDLSGIDAQITVLAAHDKIGRASCRERVAPPV